MDVGFGVTWLGLVVGLCVALIDGFDSDTVQLISCVSSSMQGSDNLDKIAQHSQVSSVPAALMTHAEKEVF